MLQQPAQKYTAFQGPQLNQRSWSSNVTTKAPRWLSTDLRDGNQALIKPMDNQHKKRLWDRLLLTGFKEIEVGFPSASVTEFNFVRQLIEENLIPDDVTVQVLTPAREELIKKTFESLQGIKQATVHLYNATSPIFRDQVFRKSRKEVIQMAVDAMKLMVKLAQQYPETVWSFEYSPEAFSETELDFAKEIIDAVCWQSGATRRHQLIVNLPNTVEICTPNIFADQVEWMHTHLSNRECLVLSVHPHNDRGTAVAAAELALLAGAERVEGCLFGNGERTGNVCLLTLALNLYTQGIHPDLDFSEMDKLIQDYQQSTQMQVPVRHPYAGELVYTAFSGSHQDAISKSLSLQQKDSKWHVPYLPLDPMDVGRDYQAVVRVNGQSGKGGIAFLLEQIYGIKLPKGMQVKLSGAVQQISDTQVKEMSATEIYQIMLQQFMPEKSKYCYVGHQLTEDTRQSDYVFIEVEMEKNQQTKVLNGRGKGPIDAFANALKDWSKTIQLIDYVEHSLDKGAGAMAVAYVAIAGENNQPQWGMGMDSNIVSASLRAMVNALNNVD
jgi:2-isopropylmalate synthase